MVGVLVGMVGAITPGAGASMHAATSTRAHHSLRNSHLAQSMQAGLHASAVHSAAATVPSPYAATDATGDADPRADITAYAVYYNPSTITLAFKTVTMTDPRTAPEWDCINPGGGTCGESATLHGIDVNGDANADFLVGGIRDPNTGNLIGEVTDATPSFNHLCNATFDWSSTGGYTLSFYPGCLGGFGPISLIFGMEIDTNPFGSTAAFSDDFAPAAHQYTPFVAMGAAPPPPPPPPPPTYPVKARGFVLDGYGGLHGFRTATSTGTTPVATDGPYWLGWDIARGVDMFPSILQAGYIVDGWGGLHLFSAGAPPFTPPTIGGAPYWQGWDIARDVALLRDGKGGFVLDGFGGLHGFSIGNNLVPVASGAPYWLGWDIARGVTMLADGTGYVVDGFGGIHPFTTNATTPAATQLGPYWPGFNIAQGVTVLRDASEGIGGYVLDGYGGLSGFDIAGNGGTDVPGPPIDGPYWLGWNIARGVAITSE